MIGERVIGIDCSRLSGRTSGLSATDQYENIMLKGDNKTGMDTASEKRIELRANTQ